MILTKALSISSPEGPIPATLYRPTTDDPLPLLVHFQGGGFVYRYPPENHKLCCGLVQATGCGVITVAYRLAPAHPFPAAINDCYVAVTSIAAQAAELGGHSEKLGVIGESAGGALAAAVALRAKTAKGPRLTTQILLYPFVAGGMTTPSRETLGPDSALPTIMAAWTQYATSAADAMNPLAAPLQATDVSGLPPALVITGENDPLRDEGKMYADKLRLAGVFVTHHQIPGAPHGFLTSKKTAGMRDAAFDLIREAVVSAFPGMARLHPI